MFDCEDLEGAALLDAVESLVGKDKSQSLVKWPNDAYCDFMQLVIENNLSNKLGDKIIKFFNRHSQLQKSLLPSTTKGGKDFIGHIKSPMVNFKEKIVGQYKEINIVLHYRPIFHALQTLLQRPNITDEFALFGILKYEEVKYVSIAIEDIQRINNNYLIISA